MILKEALIQSLSFAVRDSRFPHICRALLRFPLFIVNCNYFLD